MIKHDIGLNGPRGQGLDPGQPPGAYGVCRLVIQELH